MVAAADEQLLGSLAAWCQTRRSYGFLPAGATGWCSGGCALFALAVSGLIPGSETWGIWGYRAQGDDEAGACVMPGIGFATLQHVVVKVGDCFLDGSGVMGHEVGAVANEYALDEDLGATAWRPVSWLEIAEGDEIACSSEAVDKIRGALEDWVRQRSQPSRPKPAASILA